MTTLRILWLALLASTFVYLAVLVLVPTPAPSGDLSVLALVFGVVASSTAGASVALPPLLYRAALARETWETREVAAPDASILRGQPTRTVHVLDDAATALGTARRLFMTPFLVGMALAESVAIFGLVLGLLGLGLPSVLPFFVFCWALFAWHFPREARVTRPVEAAADARFWTAGS